MFKSVIVLKDQVFCPNYNGYDCMLEELGIDDTRENASSKFVKVKLQPTNDDIFTPIKSWKMCIDQDVRPNWFLEEMDKLRVQEAVELWAQSHIFCGVNNLELEGTDTYYIKNSTVSSYGQAAIVAYDSYVALYDTSEADLHGTSKADLYDDSKAYTYDDSEAVLNDTSKVYAYHNSRIKAYHNSTATIYDRSEIEMHGHSIGFIRSSAYKGHFTLTGKALIINYSNDTLYQSNDSAFMKIS